MNVEELRSSGYIIQEDPRLFTLRLNLPAGNLTLEQVEAIARITREFGGKNIHLTTRQAVQIPNIRFDDLDTITKELEGCGINMGTCGPRYRNTTACPGWPECKNGTSRPRKATRPGTVDLTVKLHEMFFGQEGPGKFKIGISGCPNMCSRAIENCIGLTGVVEPELNESECNGCTLCAFACKEGALEMKNDLPVIYKEACINCGDCLRNCPTGALFAKKEGYDMSFGGRLARHPQFAKRLIRFADEETIIDVVGKTIEFYQKKGEVGERFASTLNRVGKEKFLEYIGRKEDPE